MRDTLEVDERYVKNSCLNEEKSERHLFEKDLSLFIFADYLRLILME